jgi:putative colanic acid biosynthesis UDP-glucose lipid carrier transferase
LRPRRLLHANAAIDGSTIFTKAAGLASPALEHGFIRAMSSPTLARRTAPEPRRPAPGVRAPSDAAITAPDVELRPAQEEPLIGHSWRKRSFDFAFALFALVVLAPTLLLIALMIKLETGGPALYRQQRTGYQGRVFTIFKFRTMSVMEDSSAVRQATVGDSRVTRVGAVLRRLSLDELPQLVNVLTGDMSLIGPRPHALAHDNFYAAHIENYPHRFLARPGLTGLAQVNGFRGETRQIDCMRRRVDADCEYIRRWNFRFDLVILLRTVPLLFRDPQAY